MTTFLYACNWWYKYILYTCKDTWINILPLQIDVKICCVKNKSNRKWKENSRLNSFLNSKFFTKLLWNINICVNMHSSFIAIPLWELKWAFSSFWPVPCFIIIPERALNSYFVSGGKKTRVIIEGVIHQGTESVEQFQQLFYILLWVLRKKQYLSQCI